jgi:hypothetical protein
MSDGVTDFWNALHINNTTNTDQHFHIVAKGYKQLFSTDNGKRNVPDGHTDQEYDITIPANGSVTIGCGIFRNGSFDQQTSIEFVNSGTLNFTGTTAVHGSDMSQVTFWYPAANPSGPSFTVPTGTMWNFNNHTNPVLTISAG